MAFRLSSRSIERLEGVNPVLVDIVNLAITKTKVDFGVSCGVRTLDTQKKLVETGKSQTMRSYHLLQDDMTSWAVDLVAYIDGDVCWEVNVYDDDKFANLLTAIEKRGGFLNVEIRCEGHTDDLPLPKNAPFQSNWDLSTSRALNIVKLLSDFSRIPESKFSAMGYGEHRPVLPISSIGKNSVDIRKARAKNRRVEIYMDAFIKQNTLTN